MGTKQRTVGNAATASIASAERSSADPGNAWYASSASAPEQEEDRGWWSRLTDSVSDGASSAWKWTRDTAGDVKDWAWETGSSAATAAEMAPALWGGLHLNKVVPEDGVSITWDDSDKASNKIDYDLNLFGNDSATIPAVRISSISAGGVSAGALSADGIQLDQLGASTGDDGVERHQAQLTVPSATAANVQVGEGDITADSVQVTGVTASRTYAADDWRSGFFSAPGNTDTQVGGVSVTGLKVDGTAVEDLSATDLSAAVDGERVDASAANVSAAGITTAAGTVDAASATDLTVGGALDGSSGSASLGRVDATGVDLAGVRADAVRTDGAHASLVDGVVSGGLDAVTASGVTADGASAAQITASGLTGAHVLEGGSTLVNVGSATATDTSALGLNAATIAANDTSVRLDDGRYDARVGSVGIDKVTGDGPAVTRADLTGVTASGAMDGTSVTAAVERGTATGVDAAGVRVDRVGVTDAYGGVSGDAFSAGVQGLEAEGIATDGTKVDRLTGTGLTAGGGLDGSDLRGTAATASVAGVEHVVPGLDVRVGSASATDLSVGPSGDRTAVSASDVQASGVRAKQWVKTEPSGPLDPRLLNQAAGLVRDADVRAGVDLRAGTYDAGGSDATVAPGTRANVSAAVRDGNLVPSATRATMSRPVDTALHTSLSGVYVDKNGKVMADVNGWFDQNLTGSLGLRGVDDRLPLGLTDIASRVPTSTGGGNSGPSPIAGLTANADVVTNPGTISTGGVTAELEGRNRAAIEYSQSGGRGRLGVKVADLLLKSLGIDSGGTSVDVDGLRAKNLGHTQVDTTKGSTVSTTTVDNATADRVRGLF